MSESLLYHLRKGMARVEGMLVKLSENDCKAKNNNDLIRDFGAVVLALGDLNVDGVFQVLEETARFTTYGDEFAVLHRFLHLAKSSRKLSQSLQKEMLTSELYEWYGAWCNIPKKETFGVVFRDGVWIFTETGRRYVHKDPSHNIYKYIDVPLKDPVLQINVDRLSTILATTFWQNRPALKCFFSGICLAMRGHNVDQAQLGVSPGGAGQSITTALLDAMFPGLHAYIDRLFDSPDNRNQLYFHVATVSISSNLDHNIIKFRL
jgi:hypothetical protein